MAEIVNKVLHIKKDLWVVKKQELKIITNKLIINY